MSGKRANGLATTPELLAKMAKEVAEQLLLHRLENKIQSKVYEKFDFNILENNDFFNIQVTRCKLGSPAIKPLLTYVLKPYLKAQKVESDTVVAIVQKKLVDTIDVQKVFYSKKRLTLINDPHLLDAQRELSSSKHYTSIKILFQVQSTVLEKFYDHMLAYIMQIESYDHNIKFLFRKGSHYIYRNQVWMDNIVISCKIFSSACENIFQTSKDETFRKGIMELLDLKKPGGLEATVGCKLIAKANKQFKVPGKSMKTDRQQSLGDDTQMKTSTMDIV